MLAVVWNRALEWGYPLSPRQIVNPEQTTQTYEIVCLEHQNRCLYAEIVQRTKERYWVRPLALADLSDKRQSQGSPHICDLRGCSDLLWPQVQWRTVLDLELLPVLAFLQTDKPTSAALNPEASQYLHDFLRRVCVSSTC